MVKEDMQMSIWKLTIGKNTLLLELDYDILCDSCCLQKKFGQKNLITRKTLLNQTTGSQG
jgi:hypothetical protein